MTVVALGFGCESAKIRITHYATLSSTIVSPDESLAGCGKARLRCLQCLCYIYEITCKLLLAVPSRKDTIDRFAFVCCFGMVF